MTASWRSCTALGVTLLTLLTPALARAEDKGFPAPLELRLGLGWTRDDVSGVNFTGKDTIAGSSSPTALHATGSQLGYLHPALFGAEVEAGIAVSPFFHLGAAGAIAVAGGPDGAADAGGSGTSYRAGDLSVFAVALAPGFRLELRDVPVRFLLEARVGLRFETLPLLGLGMTSCASATCTFNAHHNAPFVQPQLRVDYRFSRTFALGLFVGTDAAPSPLRVLSAGAHMAVDTPSF